MSGDAPTGAKNESRRVAVDTSGDLVDKGLKANAIGFEDSVVMGLASTAPA